MKRAIILGLLAALGTVTIAVSAYQAQGGQQPRRAKVPDIYKLRENLYVIGGSMPEYSDEFTGGNTAVWVTEKGVVVVDTKNPTWGQMILDAIKRVTNKPVIMVLTSHGHNDHAGSNPEMPPPPNVEYVVHENIRAMWGKSDCQPVANCQVFRGEKAAWLPKKTFKDKMTFFDGSDRVEIYWFGRGHTNGDTWIVFPAARAMHVGDLYRPRVAPFMDVDNGGSGVEFGETLAKGVAGIKNVDTVIPGHGLAMTFDDLKLHRDFLLDLTKRVREGIKAGKNAEQLFKEYPTPAPFKGYMEGNQAEGGRASLQRDIKIIYDELMKK